MATILLVDDDLDILKLGSRILSMEGHFVFTAKDVMQAMDYLASKPIDLIITDAKMPVHTGFDFVQTIKHNPRTVDIPVIFLTGQREQVGIEMAMKLGVEDYIVKPIDPHTLLLKVKTVLQKFSLTGPQKVDFSEGRVGLRGKLFLDILLLSISELGMELYSPQAMEEGQKVSLESPIFKEMGIQVPLMKILSCEPKNGRYKLKIQFFGLSEKDLTAIRTWISENSSTMVA